MPKIHRLPVDLANQIAAGEVVERPASVVKELVENALDAGARRVTVTVEYGGKRLVRVEDDGEGMEPEDARLALERHATSKIRTSADLAAIATLGFRGEALPSIASVSHLTLRTRARGAMTGTEIKVHGGTVASVIEVGAPEGTRIDVEDLFYNLPARRKFLKSDQAESAQVSRIVTQLALCAHEVGFSFVSAGRRLHGVPAGVEPARAPLPDLRRRRRPDRTPQGGRRHPRHRLRCAAGRDRPAPRAAERLHQRPPRTRQDDRARHRRRLQRRVDQGAQPGSALVHRDAARRARRERAPDEGRSALPRAVADARGDSPRRRRRPGDGAGADADIGALGRAIRLPDGRDAADSRRAGRRAVSEPLAHGSAVGLGRCRHVARGTRHRTRPAARSTTAPHFRHRAPGTQHRTQH